MLIKFNELLAGNLKESQSVWICRHDDFTNNKNPPIVECIYLGFNYVRSSDASETMSARSFSVREKTSGDILEVPELFDDKASAYLHLCCLAEKKIKAMSLDIAMLEKEVNDKNSYIKNRKQSIEAIKKSLSNLR